MASFSDLIVKGDLCVQGKMSCSTMFKHSIILSGSGYSYYGMFQLYLPTNIPFNIGTLGNFFLSNQSRFKDNLPIVFRSINANADGVHTFYAGMITDASDTSIRGWAYQNASNMSQTYYAFKSCSDTVTEI